MAENSDDRIAKLPDDIVCHILSFLPTRDAFKTTLVSPRFVNPWKIISLTTLCLTRDPADTEDWFISFVNSIFRSIETRCIHKWGIELSIELSGFNRKPLFRENSTKWIYAAIAKNVKILELVDAFSRSYLDLCLGKDLIIIGISREYLDSINIGGSKYIFQGKMIWAPSIKTVSQCEMDVFESLSNVKVLALDVSCRDFCCFRLQTGGNSSLLPMFPNLNDLTLRNFSNQFNFLKELLQKSPILETLCLKCIDLRPSTDFSEEGLIRKRYKCLKSVLSHLSSGGYKYHANISDGSSFLRMVKVEDFYGSIDQFKVLKHILMNASLLNTMKIMTRPYPRCI